MIWKNSENANTDPDSYDSSTIEESDRSSFTSWILKPRGIYVHLGNRGIFYEISREKPTTQTATSSIFDQTQSYDSKPNYSYVSNKRVAALKATNHAQTFTLGRDIVNGIIKSKWILFLWLLLSVFLAIFYGWWGLAISMILGSLFYNFFTTHLFCELDPSIENEWQKLIYSLNEMSQSKGIWIVDSSSINTRPKVNAGAYHNITRRKASVKIIKANRFTGVGLLVDVPTFMIKSKKRRFLFMPCGIVVINGHQIQCYSYEQIELISSTTRFVEDGLVYSDSKIIRMTWQFVNVDGSPDRRFKNNRQIPLCLYGNLTILGDGLNAEFHTSKQTATYNIDTSYRMYKNSFLRLCSTTIHENNVDNYYESSRLPRIDNKSISSGPLIWIKNNLVLIALIVLACLFVVIALQPKDINNINLNTENYAQILESKKEQWESVGYVDYPDVVEFEQAVNNGADLVGKTVTFTVIDVKPKSILGYNLYGGEHLNFVSNDGVGISKGEEITVLVTSTKRIIANSYKVTYILINR